MIARFRSYVVGLPRVWKGRLLIVFDFLALSAALWASFSLRLDNWGLPDTLADSLIVLAGPVVAIPVFVRMGLYRSVVRYLPERALWTMIQAVTLAVVLWVLVAFLSLLMESVLVPRSVPIIYWALASLVIVGSRFAAKQLLFSGAWAQPRALPAVAIYGAGEAGTQLALSLRSSHRVIGFIDDNPSLHRHEVAGLRVYPPSSLPSLTRNYGVNHVILSMLTLSNARRAEIVATMKAEGVQVSSIPAMVDLVTGKYTISQVREIEIDDLLAARLSLPTKNSSAR